MGKMVNLEAISTEWSEEEEFTAEQLLETALDNCIEAVGDLADNDESDGDILMKVSNVEMAIKELYEIWGLELPSWAE